MIYTNAALFLLSIQANTLPSIIAAQTVFIGKYRFLLTVHSCQLTKTHYNSKLSALKSKIKTYRITGECPFFYLHCHHHIRSAHTHTFSVGMSDQPPSHLVILSMEVCSRDDSEYRILTDGQVKYLTIAPGTYDRPTLSKPLGSLPRLPQEGE